MKSKAKHLKQLVFACLVGCAGGNVFAADLNGTWPLFSLFSDESVPPQTAIHAEPSGNALDLTTLPLDLERDFSMLAYDLLDVPPSHVTQIVVRNDSGAASPTPSSVRAVGQCMVVASYPGAEVNLQNSLDAKAAAEVYFYSFERKQRLDTTDAKITFVTQPKHGKITDVINGMYHYEPYTGYNGKDRIEALVEAGGYKVRVFYDILSGGSDIGSDWENLYCPKGLFWKISLESAPDSGTADLLAWQRASDLSTLLATASQSLTGFQDLAGSAVGNTAGEGANAAITLDFTAAGHSWYVDATPLDNTDDYLPTSNPNLWQAKAGSDAAGKMDMLSVLLHEYGHALGLEHSADSGDYMAAALQPGQRPLTLGRRSEGSSSAQGKQA